MFPRVSYILKTEPSEYSYEDLEREGRTVWNGVKNPLAQRHISSMKPGELCFIYHTGKIKAVVGLARVVSEAYLDRDGFWVVDVEPAGRLKRQVSLATLKGEPAFAQSPLVRMPRLSVIPLNEDQSMIIWELSQSS